MKGIYVDRPIPQGITITFYLGPYQSQMMARLKRTKLTVLHGKASWIVKHDSINIITKVVKNHDKDYDSGIWTNVIAIGGF